MNFRRDNSAFNGIGIVDGTVLGGRQVRQALADVATPTLTEESATAAEVEHKVVTAPRSRRGKGKAEA